MKLTNLISAFQKRPDHEAAIAQNAATRSGIRSQGGHERVPEPPPLARSRDRVTVSNEASFAVAATKYDPYRLTPRGLTELAEQLHEDGAIGSSEQAILLGGPYGKGYFGDDYNQPRNFIGDWQERLAQSLGKSDLVGIDRATRALDILSRVHSSRILI